jgi:hypothetical protein
MQRMLLILATILTATTARAADTAHVRPAQDVVVTYRSTGMTQAGAGTVTMHFANQGNIVRIDGTNGAGYLVFDSTSGRTLVVMPEKKMYAARPSDANQMPVFLSLNMTLAKTGTDTIAGTKCTRYDASVKDRKGQICLTDDGVLLRAQGGAPGHTQMLEALSVIYTPQASAMFDPPPGFQNADTASASQNAPFNDSGVSARPRGSYWGNQTGR